MDSVVGSVGDGVTMRMISDIKGVKYTEGRLLPISSRMYSAREGIRLGGGGRQLDEGQKSHLRSPLDRIGYGGYLKLAIEWPGFI